MNGNSIARAGIMRGVDMEWAKVDSASNDNLLWAFMAVPEHFRQT